MTAVRLTVVGLAALLALGYFGLRQVSTAGNTVPSSRAGIDVLEIYADDLAPTECEALRLTLVIRGAGSIDGSKGRDLILGSLGADDISGRQGDDCLVGGGGNDDLDGGGGNNVCIGGPGNDKFTNCDVKIQ